MSVDILTPEQRAGIAALAARAGWRLVVLFGSSARGTRGRDVDLAVMPTRLPDLFEQGAWQAELEDLLAPQAVDLVMLTDATSPVTRFEVFRTGRCLFEAEPHLFDREADRAFFLYADTEIFRRASVRCSLERPDRAVFERKLAALRRFLSDLRTYAALDDQARRREHYAIERLLQLLCESAADVALQILKARGYALASSYREVFAALEQHGDLPEDLARPLIAACGMRNVLTHFDNTRSTSIA